jgi:hypothetical protein
VDSIVVRQRERVYVSARDRELCALACAYRDELAAKPYAELIAMYEALFDDRPSKTSRSNAEKTARPARIEGRVTPTEFTKKHEKYVLGGKREIERFFRGKSRKKGEVPEAKQFSIGDGQYDEARIVAYLKKMKRYSEIGYAAL